MSPLGNRELSVVALDTGTVNSQDSITTLLDTILTSPDPSEAGVIGAFVDKGGTGQLALVCFDGTTDTPLALDGPVQGLVRWVPCC